MSEAFVGAASIASIVFFIAFFLLMLFMVLVQPIWCLIDCAVDNRRSGGSKALWIIVLVIFYGIANWFYGALAAAGPMLRRLTRLAWFVLILLVVAFIALSVLHPEFRRGIEQEWRRGRDLVVLAPLPLIATNTPA